MVLLYGQESLFQPPAFFGGQRGLAAVVDVPLSDREVTSLNRQVSTRSARVIEDVIDLPGLRQGNASATRGGQVADTYNSQGISESLALRIKSSGGSFYQTDSVNQTKTVATVAFNVTQKSIAGDTQQVRDAVAIYNELIDQEDQFIEFRYGLDPETGLDINGRVTQNGIEIPGNKTIGFDKESILQAVEDGLLDIPTSLDINITEVQGYNYFDEATGELKTQESFTLIQLGSKSIVVPGKPVEGEGYQNLSDIEERDEITEVFSVTNEVEKIEEQESVILTFTYKDPIDYAKIYRQQQELNIESRVLASIAV